MLSRQAHVDKYCIVGKCQRTLIAVCVSKGLQRTIIWGFEESRFNLWHVYFPLWLTWASIHIIFSLLHPHMCLHLQMSFRKRNIARIVDDTFLGHFTSYCPPHFCRFYDVILWYPQVNCQMSERSTFSQKSNISIISLWGCHLNWINIPK